MINSISDALETLPADDEEEGLLFCFMSCRVSCGFTSIYFH
jgi:hypothetical protein